MSEGEEDELLIDYSQLLNKKSKQKNQAPKRGEKANVSNQVTQEKLAKSRQALFECISQHVNIPKNASHGQLDTSLPFYTIITKSRGTHLHSMGFTHSSAIALFPEEAAFLVARNALIVTQQEDPIQFEDYCEIMCESGDGWITFDKYQVYAYLKRLGFIVTRSRKLPTTTTTEMPTIKPPMPSIFKLFFDTITNWIQPKQNRPLVWDYRYINYPQIYSTLQIIPSSPWYKPFYSSLCPTFDWDVYKPRPSWKKKDPGEPDFRILVKNTTERMPTLYEQNQLFSQLTETSNANYKPQLKHTELKLHGPTFVLALVGDAEGISFLRLTGDGLADVSNVEIHNQKKNRTSC